MISYLIRRLAYLVPLWVGLSVFAFALGKLAPGDPARALLSQQLGMPPSDEQVARFEERHGLDDPAVVQYARWVGNAVRGDLGVSFRSGDSVFDSLRRSFPVTVQLSLLAFLIAVGVGVPLGAWAALRRGRVADHFSRLLALGGASLPTFWLGYLLILVFAVQLQLLPSQGNRSPISYLLPALTLATYAMGVLVRLTRASLLDVLGEEFVLVARARGLPRRSVLVRHALRVALNPVATYGGLLVGGLLGGAVIVETVFGLPGVGALAVEAINDRDFPVVQGFVLYVGTLVLLANLAVDVCYVLIDPRVRLMEDSRVAA